jgi:hypothetical protein
VSDGYESIGELGRAFDDFRQEARDQMKFIMRLVVSTLVGAILGGALTSFIALTRGSPV